MKWKHMNKPTSYVYHIYVESVHRLFFDYVIVWNTGHTISNHFGRKVDVNYEYIYKFSLSSKKHVSYNAITIVVLCST
jgi:hypothetical protein